MSEESDTVNVNSTAIPVALTIAGSDSGGGAGIQADLKTFSALGVYGASVITAVTAQNTQAVTAVHDIPADIITAQIRAVLDDIRVDAIKIGMLSSVDTIDAVLAGLANFTGPIVVDPVMVAKSGDHLLQPSAVAALRTRMLPKATVLTPNLPEAAVLTEQEEATTERDTVVQGERLLAMGAAAVLMKGGHATGDSCHDHLIIADKPHHTLTAKRIDTRNTHGTGCTLSSAIAALMAQGNDIGTAVTEAHSWLHNAIVSADALDVGRGHGPVHHFHALWQ